MRAFFRQPLDDVVACLEPIVTLRNPLRALSPLLISVVLSWVVYVPIHELLHALGCWATGGDVTRLEISPRYGGGWLAEVFPFVVSGGEYAGRLSGFDTKGSDLTYLATDFMPYVLTVVLGVPLLKLAGRQRRPLTFGLAIVTGLAPFYSLPGDYFEMGSIVSTRIVTLLRGGGPVAYETLRSDDIFKLIETFCTNPADLGLHNAGLIASGILIVIVSLALALLFALVTYALGHRFSTVIVKPRSALNPLR